MSSILDALKKLEEEKAAREKNEAGEGPSLAGAGADLHKPITRHDPAHSLSPKMLIASVAVVSVVLVAVSVTVSVLLLRPATNTPVAAVVPETPAPAIVPEPAEPAMAAVAEDEDTPASEASGDAQETPRAVPTPEPEPEEAPVEMAPAKTTLARAPTAAPEPKPAPAPAPQPEPEVVSAPAPAPRPVVQSTPPPPPPSPAPKEPVALRAEDVAPVSDLRSLPELRMSDRKRYGLENMQVNFLRQATPQRPSAMAVINLNKIHIGEVIPGSEARLIAVQREGIGIEIAGNGERFFVRI